MAAVKGENHSYSYESLPFDIVRLTYLSLTGYKASISIRLIKLRSY